jgi:hypothetical protein
MMNDPDDGFPTEADPFDELKSIGEISAFTTGGAARMGCGSC